MIRRDLETQLREALSSIDSASSDFDLNPDVVLPEGRKLTPAAVLICIRENGSVILTKRSARLKNHPGQIAFPGGKMDASDASIVDAALREAKEEIGLPPTSVEVLGTLPQHETVTSFAVTPVVAMLRGDFRITPEEGEVSEVFSTPLAHLLDTDKYVVESRIWQKTRRYYYAVPYGPYYIWGATARILRGLAEGLRT